MTKMQHTSFPPSVRRADKAAYYGFKSFKSIEGDKSTNTKFSLEAATTAHEECV